MQLKLFLRKKIWEPEAISQTKHDNHRTVIGQSPWLWSSLVKVIDPFFTREIYIFFAN